MKRRTIYIAILFFMLQIVPGILRYEGNAVHADERNRKMREDLKVLDRPIRFYGKVIDQNNNPVIDALIYFSIRNYIQIKDMTIKSDPNGLFDVSNEKGNLLFIDRIEKKGYEFQYENNRNRGFVYGDWREENTFKPDRNKPIIFKMRKKEPPTVVLPCEFNNNYEKNPEQEIDLAGCRGFRPGYIAKNYQKDGHIDLKINAALSKDGNNYKITIVTHDPNSGIVQSDELAYVAPTNGYEPSISLIIPASGKLQKYLYVKSRKGQVYSRLDTWFGKGRNGLEGHIKSWTNPNGQRNVDYDAEIYGKEQLRRFQQDQKESEESAERIRKLGEQRKKETGK